MIIILGIERRQKIMELLRQDRKVYVANLSKLFKVTEETVRRDLEKLEVEELLTRSYGGAVLKEHTMEDLSFPKRTIINHDAKEAIALKAENLINDGDTLMIDASTTCLALLQRLTVKRNLTLITNSVKLVNDFADAGFSIISTGGSLRAHSYALIGENACSTLKNYYVDLAVISCKAIEVKCGIMESNEDERIIKQLMMTQAKTKILLADHTKFNKIAFTKIADLNEVDYIVTDLPPSPEWSDFCQSNGIKLIF